MIHLRTLHLINIGRYSTKAIDIKSCIPTPYSKAPPKPRKVGDKNSPKPIKGHYSTFFWGPGSPIKTLNPGTPVVHLRVVSQRVHIHYHYGIRYRKTIPVMVVGP